MCAFLWNWTEYFSVTEWIYHLASVTNTAWHHVTYSDSDVNTFDVPNLSDRKEMNVCIFLWIDYLAFAATGVPLFFLSLPMAISMTRFVLFSVDHRLLRVLRQDDVGPSSSHECYVPRAKLLPSPPPSPGLAPTHPPTHPRIKQFVKNCHFPPSILGIVTTVLVAVTLFGKTVYNTIRRLFEGTYKPIGRATTVGFSEVDQIQAYVPEVR